MTFLMGSWSLYIAYCIPILFVSPLPPSLGPLPLGERAISCFLVSGVLLLVLTLLAEKLSRVWAFHTRASLMRTERWAGRMQEVTGEFATQGEAKGGVTFASFPSLRSAQLGSFLGLRNSSW